MTSRLEAQSRHPKWVLLLAVFATLLSNSSLGYHVGILNMAVIDNFQSDSVAISWLMPLYGSMFALGGPIGSVLIYFTNCRSCVFLAAICSLIGYILCSYSKSYVLFFFSLILAGAGQGMSQAGSILYLAYNFPDDVALVTGICMAGSGLGSFIHPVLLQIMLDQFGFQGALLLIGAIAFQACVPAMFFCPTQYETQKTVLDDKSFCMSFMSGVSTRMAILRQPLFGFFLLATFFWSVKNMTILVFLPEFVTSVLGLSKKQASLTASFLGMGSVVSRLFNAFATSDKRIESLLLFMGVTAVASILCFSSGAILQGMTGASVFSFLIGIYSSGAFPLIPSTTVELMGVRLANTCLGVTMLVCGLGGFVGTPVAALLLKKFELGFLFPICGIICIVACTFSMMTALFKTSHASSSSAPSQACPNRPNHELGTNQKQMHISSDPDPEGQQETEHSRFIDHD